MAFAADSILVLLDVTTEGALAKSSAGLLGAASVSALPSRSSSATRSSRPTRPLSERRPSSSRAATASMPSPPRPRSCSPTPCWRRTRSKAARRRRGSPPARARRSPSMSSVSRATMRCRRPPLRLRRCLQRRRRGDVRCAGHHGASGIDRRPCRGGRLADRRDARRRGIGAQGGDLRCRRSRGIHLDAS